MRVAPPPQRADARKVAHVVDCACSLRATACLVCAFVCVCSVPAGVQVGAWKSGTDIRPDEIVHSELKLSYDGKRDRYNGYDPAAHKLVVERYEKAEAERRKVKAAERNKEFAAGAGAAEGGGAAALATAGARVVAARAV